MTEVIIVRNFLKWFKEQTAGLAERMQSEKLVIVANTDYCFRSSVNVLKSSQAKVCFSTSITSLKINALGYSSGVWAKQPEQDIKD